MLLGQVLVLVGVRVVLGVMGVALLTRLMESLLFGVTALDPATYAAVAGGLIATGAVAGYRRRGAPRASIRCWRSERNSPIQ